MSQTPEELAAEISQLASRLAVRTDLADAEDQRRALYDLASALSALQNPLDIWAVGAAEYPEDITGGELAAPGAALKETVRAVHHLLGKL
ncbi:hypothetical protein [Streptomyces chartreusis]|uniref:hypothetical protein n=1 Tax=Streptomyces chartreusis TaxID=1969 RepID=UPI0036CA6429